MSSRPGHYSSRRDRDSTPNPAPRRSPPADSSSRMSELKASIRNPPEPLRTEHKLKPPPGEPSPTTKRRMDIVVNSNQLDALTTSAVQTKIFLAEDRALTGLIRSAVQLVNGKVSLEEVESNCELYQLKELENNLVRERVCLEDLAGIHSEIDLLSKDVEEALSRLDKEGVECAKKRRLQMAGYERIAGDVNRIETQNELGGKLAKNLQNIEELKNNSNKLIQISQYYHSQFLSILEVLK